MYPQCPVKVDSHSPEAISRDRVMSSTSRSVVGWLVKMGVVNAAPTPM